MVPAPAYWRLAGKAPQIAAVVDVTFKAYQIASQIVLKFVSHPQHEHETNVSSPQHDEADSRVLSWMRYRFQSHGVEGDTWRAGCAMDSTPYQDCGLPLPRVRLPGPGLASYRRERQAEPHSWHTQDRPPGARVARQSPAR